MESLNKQEKTPKCHLTPTRGGVAARSFLRRTPFSGRRGVHSSFKSPAQSSPALASQASPEQEAEQLRRKRVELDGEIALLQSEGIDIQELEQHIDLLHEYNDIKDVAQTLLGQLVLHLATKLPGNGVEVASISAVQGCP
ncbi:hypothetical protein ACEWY4_027514 [Coilia grayii]|uniref:DNA repair protein SWI5 homolog n=1 Tax=Coilia grayii TaxID=363190 RepID=A0ABD1IQI3_9TELE